MNRWKNTALAAIAALAVSLVFNVVLLTRKPSAPNDLDAKRQFRETFESDPNWPGLQKTLADFEKKRALAEEETREWERKRDQAKRDFENRIKKDQ